MELLTGIKTIDLSIFIEKPKVLIIGDLHLGLEENLTAEGILIPKFHLKELIEKIEKILQQAKPETIIINGDLKHEFGKISSEEWRNTLKIIDFLAKKAKLVITKGNHDSFLSPIAKKRGIELAEYYIYEDIYVCHGHRIPEDKAFKKAKTIIIGHEHPAIAIDDTIRRETFKCFLLGKYKAKNLIVMPSLNLLTEGTNILREKLLSPFLKNIDDFKVLVVGDKVYDFGLVKGHY